MIRILIVDDSDTVRQLLTYELDRQSDLQVVGLAANGLEAVKQAAKLKPDVITMDVKMPVMDGLEATREIMCTQACPVIIVSQFWDQNNKQKIFEALEAGAIAVANKPAGPGHPDYDRSITHLLKTIRMMSEVKVITRRRSKPVAPRPTVKKFNRNGVTCPPACRPDCAASKGTCNLVVMGASTGGPVVLREILERLPVPFPLPILIVQHIAPGFLPGLTEWLQNTTGHTTEIATSGLLPQPGRVYFAPDDRHMGINASGKIILSDSEKEHNLRPSVSYLFRSVSESVGNTAVGILLTGMGTDGALELRQLKDTGAPTIIQNEESCVVFGMPGEALKLDAARHILSPAEISEFLTFSISKPLAQEEPA